MIRDFLSPIYPITPGRFSTEALLAWVEALLDEGCRLLQYRRKSLTDLEQLREVEAILERSRRYGARLIVDDRCDLCRMSGADGVHLGQSDLPPQHARAFLGARSLIGLSTHSLNQARSGLQEPIDYLALGPVFPTSTKQDPDPVVPVELQLEVLEMAALPTVAIGGITAERAGGLWERGFQSVAVISALEEEPQAGWREFMRSYPDMNKTGGDHGD